MTSSQATQSSDGPLRVWLPAVRAGSGADVFVERLAQGLQRRGHEPIVQWFPHHYELMPWLLRKAKPPPRTDITHTNSWQGFAFKRGGIPLVVTEHHDVEDPAFVDFRNRLQGIYHRTFIRTCLKRSYAAADRLVAISRHAARAMQSRVGKQVACIHNWVDTDTFCPNSLAISCAPPGRPFRLLFVGNPSKWKGADVLPQLARILGGTFEILCLGGLRKSIATTARISNLTSLPKVPNEAMPKVYRNADAVLITSRYEAFGYVALEAMACGLPVVGFDSTGTAEVCVNGETALLSPIDDLSELAHNCRRLAVAPDFVRTLGQAGRVRACKYFDGAESVNAYVRVYRSLRAAPDSNGLEEANLPISLNSP